jgi:O-acetyl-ADP-ribose deacetylase (regulator of RNase III)
MIIQVIYGNIVAQPDAEAVINSANANLRFGSGVAGAIHTAAGDELEDYCEPFAPLALGHAILTPTPTPERFSRKYSLVAASCSLIVFKPATKSP